MNKLTKQIFKFLIVGGIAFLIDYALLYILTEYSAWLLPSAGLLTTSTVAAFIECSACNIAFTALQYLFLYPYS